jgi:hypothetical protein
VLGRCGGLLAVLAAAGQKIPTSNSVPAEVALTGKRRPGI